MTQKHSSTRAMIPLDISRKWATRIILVVIVVETFITALPGKSVDAIPSTTVQGTSYYMDTAGGSIAYNLGCSLGTQDYNTPGTQSRIAIISFGQAWWYDDEFFGRVYGSNLHGNDTFVNDSQVEEAAYQFGRGYYICTSSDITSQLQLAVGTTNYWSGAGVSHTDYGHGQVWTAMVNRVQNRLVNAGYSSQSNAHGGMDMELDWNTPSNSRAWINGFASNAITRRSYFDGDAAGCPESTAPGLGASCNNGWKQDDLWWVTWGAAPAYPIPQIYFSTLPRRQAYQWKNVSLYAYLYKTGKISFQGSLTQYYACFPSFPPPDCKSESVETNTPAAGWDQLFNALASDSRTSQSTLTWSTDIRWR